MTIELVKVKIDDAIAYKHKPIKYCCEKLKNNPCVTFTQDNIIDTSYSLDDEEISPQFCVTYLDELDEYGETWDIIENHPIQFCPHCGEKIEIEIVDEIDVTEKYKLLKEKRQKLWKECQQTDSKNKEKELRIEVQKLDKKINKFYDLEEFTEGKGEYVIETV